MDKYFIQDKIDKLEKILLNEESLTKYVENVDKKIQIEPNVSKRLEEKVFAKVYNTKQKYSGIEILKIACFTLCVVLGWQLLGNIPKDYNKVAKTKESNKIEISTRFENIFEKFSNSMMNYERKGE